MSCKLTSSLLIGSQSVPMEFFTEVAFRSALANDSCVTDYDNKLASFRSAPANGSYVTDYNNKLDAIRNALANDNKPASFRNSVWPMAVTFTDFAGLCVSIQCIT